MPLPGTNLAGLSVGDYVGVVSLLLNLAVALIGGTWGISRINAKVSETFRTELDGHKMTTAQALDGVHKLISENELATERKIGETGRAIREKLGQVELFIRDTYVRRDTFQEMVKLMTTNVQAQFDRLDQSISKMSDKLDRLVENRQQGGRQG